MWILSPERTRRALGFTYARLTSSPSNKLYSSILLISTLSLLTLHIISLITSQTAINRVSTLIALTTNASLIPTFGSQDGQAILRLCHPGDSGTACEVITSVAPMITATPIITPVQLGSGVTTSVKPPINAVQTAAQEANSLPSVAPDVAVQAGGVRVVASSDGAKAVPSSTQDAIPTASSTGAPGGGVTGEFVAALPQPTSTEVAAAAPTTSSGLFIADTPSTTASAASADAIPSQIQGVESPPLPGLTLPTLITLLNPPTRTTADRTTTESISTSIAKEGTTTSSEVSSSTTTSEISSLESTTTSETLQSISTSSVESSTSSSSTSSSSSETSSTSSSSTETQTTSTSTSTSTESTSTKDATIVEISLPSSVATRSLPSFVLPDFATTSASDVSASFTPAIVESTPIASTNSEAPISTVVSASDLSSFASAGDLSSFASASDFSSFAASTKPEEVAISTSTKAQEEKTRSINSPSPIATKSLASSAVEPTEATLARSREQSDPKFIRRNSELYKPSSLYRRKFSAAAVRNDTTGVLTGVDVTDLGDNGSTAVTRLSTLCIMAMAFPQEQIRQARGEDTVVVGWYLWFAVVGVAAIRDESVPHLVTVFMASLFALIWSGSQLIRTRALYEQFDAFLTRGACNGIDALPGYGIMRQRLEIPILVVNAVGAVVMGIIAFRLLKKYRAKKSLSAVVRYVYKVMLVLRIAILLGGWFLLAVTVLWAQQLFTSPLAVPSTITSLLKAASVINVVLALPWVVVGWWALRAEETGGRASRLLMAIFVGITIFFLAGLTFTFASDVYREVFSRWMFFGVLSVGAFFVLVGSLGTGIVCWMRFERAPPVYFETEKPRSGTDHGHSRGGSGATAATGSFHSATEEIIPETVRWDYSNTAEKAWEPFDKASIRQSQFTSSDRQSTAFSYGLRSPAPPMPARYTGLSGSSSHLSVATAL